MNSITETSISKAPMNHNFPEISSMASILSLNNIDDVL